MITFYTITICKQGIWGNMGPVPTPWSRRGRGLFSSIGVIIYYNYYIPLPVNYCTQAVFVANGINGDIPNKKLNLKSATMLCKHIHYTCYFNVASVCLGCWVANGFSTPSHGSCSGGADSSWQLPAFQTCLSVMTVNCTGHPDHSIAARAIIAWIREITTASSQVRSRRQSLSHQWWPAIQTQSAIWWAFRDCEIAVARRI